MPTLDIQLPVLEHKWIKLYNSEEEQQADILNYTECCYWVIKNPDAGPDNEATYQYSIRTTNNDNEKLGHYYTVETADQWTGLEIIWGYFGWEWNEYTWNEQVLQGGNLFLKIATQTIKTIPDGNRLYHINYFLGSQDNVTSVESFDNSNIISAMNLNGYKPTDTVRNLTLAISDWNNVENARGMFENIQLTIANNTLNLPKATDCSYIFNSVAGTTITFNWNFPLAENLSYAFYNVEGDIAPYDNNQFIQDKVTNIDYCFGADNLKQINVNISQIATATTAKGLFRARIINNNNNNIALPVCEYLDYALKECDLSQVNGINFTSNVLKSAKGLIKNSTINNLTDTFLDSLQYLTNFNLVEDFGEYLMDMNHDSTNNSVTFDISGQTGEHPNVTLVDFCSNANINLKFIGNSKCIYDNFCQGGTLTIDTDSVFTGGQSYNNMFLGTTFNSVNLPINTLENNKEYNNLYNNCVFNAASELNFGDTIVKSADILKGSILAPNFTLTNFEKLSHCDLNFSYNTVQNLFDYTISDNTSDYICSDIEEISDADTASAYIGYKYFSIDSNFNCKKIKPQTINCSPRYIYNESSSTWYSWELINNNIIEDMSDVILNFQAGISYNWQDTKILINSKSLVHPPSFSGSDSFGTIVCNLYAAEDLILLDNFSAHCEFYIYGNQFQYLKIGKNISRVISLYIDSVNIDVNTFTQSVNNVEEITRITLKQSFYNKLDSNTQTRLQDISKVLTLLQDEIK